MDKRDVERLEKLMCLTGYEIRPLIDANTDLVRGAVLYVSKDRLYSALVEEEGGYRGVMPRIARTRVFEEPEQALRALDALYEEPVRDWEWTDPETEEEPLWDGRERHC